MAAVIARGALVLLMLVATTAHAQQSEASRLVDDARRLYLELEFERSVDAARSALAVPGARDVERASALETMGSALVVLEREDAAREAFVSLFALDPYWLVREPSGSPRIRRFVEEVRGRVVPDAAIDPERTLRMELPAAARAGRTVRVAIVLTGVDVAQVQVRARGEGELAWSAHDATAEGGGRFVVELPARDGEDELELYAEARDAQGRVVTRAEGPLAPARIPVRPAEERSIESEWWLWAAIGGAVLVVGAGIAIGVAVTDQDRAAPGTLSPGRVELPLVRF